MKKALLFIFALQVNLLFAQGNYVPLNERIRDNLYITVSVNKTECYVGEPIIATYKLYSAFESESSILKNPSFYGFEYKDIITPRDNLISRETIEGRRFDVHTIKKVQLIPSEAGKLELDALTLGNKIRILDDNGNKIELFHGVREDFTLDGSYIHFAISSVPITINVLSDNNAVKPLQYTGAAGDFRMNIQLNKNELAPNEQGVLTITIVGQGDFSKVTMPKIEWPAGINVQQAQIKDKYTRSAGGYKVFGIPFSGKAEGSYTIMPIQFSYFDTLNNRLNTITNRPITFYIRKEQQRTIILPSTNIGETSQQTPNALIIGGGVVLALLLLLLFINKRKKDRVQQHSVVAHKNTHIPAPKVASSISIDAHLQQAANARHHTGNAFYNFLKQGIMKFFEDRFAIPAVLFNRTSLKQSMTDNDVNAALQEEVLNLLTEIEMNIYSGGGLDGDKSAMLTKARNILSRLHSSI